MLKVKGNFSELISNITNINKQITNADFLEKLAFLLNSSIQRRVQQKGLGAKGKLNPYTKKYAAYKSATGRQSSYRDLTYTGNMWQALTATKQGKAAAKMFFGSATEAKKAGYNDKRDPFFELGEAEKKIINSELKKLTNL